MKSFSNVLKLSKTLRSHFHFSKTNKYFSTTDPNEKLAEIQRELAETEEEAEKRKQREERIKFLNSEYTKEELESVLNQENEITIMEIKEKPKKWLYLAKRVSLFFNIPLSWCLMAYCHYGFGDLAEAATRTVVLHHSLFLLDYLFFLNAISILYGCRNIVLLAKFLPKEKKMEFTKLSLLCKPYKIQVPADELKRVPKAMVTPFVSLKNIKNKTLYSMDGIADWKDRKLYNALFPKPIHKKPSKKDTSILKGR
jgi:hypothetical protein